MKKFYQFTTLIIVILFGFLSSILLHEFGHCVFYWMQGIPCSMSWVKEYPLQNLSVEQFAIGSWGGIIFNWILLVLLYLLTLWFLKKEMHLSSYFSRAFFYGDSILLFMYAIFFFKGADKMEFVYAQNLFNLPNFSIIIFTLVFTIVLFYFFIKKQKYNLTLGKAGLAFLVLVISFFFLVILEDYDAKTNWNKYPAIKIGNNTVNNNER